MDALKDERRRRRRRQLPISRSDANADAGVSDADFLVLLRAAPRGSRHLTRHGPPRA